MDDQTVSDHIEALVAEEHRLLEQDPGTPEHRERLEAVRVELDRYWDLLRQRRAREEFGNDPDSGTSLRDADTVEGYES
jgi:hypothetical protein